MPFTATPPEGPVTLSANARTVLEKRYLVKDKSGKPVEKPEEHVLARCDNGGRSGSALRRKRWGGDRRWPSSSIS